MNVEEYLNFHVLIGTDSLEMLSLGFAYRILAMVGAWISNFLVMFGAVKHTGLEILFVS